MTRRFDATHRTWAWYVLVLGIAALPAACSSGGGGGGGGGTPDTTAPTVQSAPASGAFVAASDPIVITFDEPVVADSVTLGGDMAAESDGGSLSSSGQSKPAAGVSSESSPSGDTLTISPHEPEVGVQQPSGWTNGSARTLVVDAADLAGNPLQTLHLTLTVFKGLVYVSPAPAGDDANDGTRDHPKATIPAAIAEAVSQKDVPGAVLVSAGTYTVDSGATPPNHVVLAEGISLYGGYSADFSQRDRGVFATMVEDSSITDRLHSTDPNRAVEAGAGITDATIVDGFEILGGAGDYSSGIFCYSGGSPTISNNRVHGGNGTRRSTGASNRGIGTSPIIRNNTINGGGGRDSLGIGDAPGASSTVLNNAIGGGSGSASYGIFASGSSSSLIAGNAIHGGSGTPSTGIAIVSVAPDVFNNTIHGGSGSSTLGIYIMEASPLLRNNTINGGSGTDSSEAIQLEGNPIPGTSISPTIEDNVVFTSGQSANRSCIRELSVDANPVSLKNNDLFDCPTALYVKSGQGNLTTIADVNALATPPASGNVSVDPSFADLDGPDDDINTVDDNDWHLTATSPTEVTQGGLDLSADFTTDKDGMTRTIPWSMGAYEQD